MTRIKICCISSAEEAAIAVRQGASAVGLVSAMPSGPGVISEALITTIAATVPPPVATVLLTSQTEPHMIVAQQHRCRVNTVQLCDRIARDDYRVLREAMPGVTLIQVVHVTDEDAVAEALEMGQVADAILLDSGNQTLAVKVLGGTGRTHDWSLSARIVKHARAPVFLAGGLNPDNVAAAIAAVRPFAVDVCSGVRTDGHLDVIKLRAFVGAVRGVG
jgi:phosphoribosylanthranilate isomerase